MTERNDIDVAKMNAQLLARRLELESLLDTAEESGKPVELDQTRVGRLSRIDAMQDQAMALETERRREVEIKRIDAALNRLETGDYGYCVACDEEIALKRLLQDPAAPNCIDCAGRIR